MALVTERERVKALDPKHFPNGVMDKTDAVARLTRLATEALDAHVPK
jgi:hypothetical protein